MDHIGIKNIKIYKYKNGGNMGLVNTPKRPGEIEEEKLLEYLNIFFKRFYSQQFKRSAMPDGPKVLNISLSIISINILIAYLSFI